MKTSYPSLTGSSSPVLAVVLLVSLAAPLHSQTADDFNPGADNFVYATAVQPDGKIVAAGSFTTLGGQPRSCLGRLDADGTLDTTFNPGATGLPVSWAVPTSVHCLAVQADGKIVVGGYFTTLGGQPRNCIGRLNCDGTVDPTFNPGLGGNQNYCFLNCMAVQADGKIVVGGYFNALGGQSRSYIARLNSDGTLDTGFNPGADAYLLSMAIQPDGKIVVGGVFTKLAGVTRNNIGRLNADGTLDTTFNPAPNSWVYTLAVQPDGKILVAGLFTTLAGQSRGHIGRLHADGSLDAGFNPGLDGGPSSLAVQADGRILVSGRFTTLGGQPRVDIGRLNADGTLDSSLNQGTEQSDSGFVSSATVQADGKILAAGNFATLAGQPRNRIGRFEITDPGTQSLTCDTTSITWMRGGVSPEVGLVSFEASTNGTNWVKLGAATRVSGGWQLTGIAVPTNALIRALGYASGGNYCGSSWVVQTVLSAPRIFSQPASRTNSPGSAASFSVVAGGVAPLSYQWLKNGVTLAESADVSGVQTPTLTLGRLAVPDEGGYSVIISNSFGSITSLVATLTVLDPFIANSPSSRNANAGDSATLTVTALGTAPLEYQWRKDGVPLTGATDESLTVTNLQRADAGAYDVVVHNVSGVITSAIAQLTVNLASADGFNPNANNTVYATANQADGKIILGGAFTTLGPQTQSNLFWVSHLGRLNADGAPDPTFAATADGTVDTLSVQADGKILVGGSFWTLNGQSRSRIGRLSSGGILDTNFNPGANSSVYCLVPQADGRILVGGAFSWLSGPGCTNVGRLNADGAQDPDFHANASGEVYSLAVQADGKVLIGGAFMTLNGQPRSHLGRLNADGSLDAQFNPSAGGPVSGLALQPDGKILVGGYFLTLGGQPRNYIGRLNPDGSLDSAFDPGANDFVFSLAVQADGKIQVGGNFTVLGGQARNRMGRLNADGTLDLTFNPGADGCVYSLALQTDGTTLVGGNFAMLDGQPRNCIGRLNGTDPAIQSLVCDTNGITWFRDGSSPEFSSTTVEVLTKAKDWVNLGTPKRIAGGWQLTGVSVPPNATIRARGLASGGQYNRSSWFVETNLLVNVPLQPCRFISVCRDSNGVVNLRFSAPAGAACTVEASTDLLTWEAIGSAEDQGDGTFAFGDITAADAPQRFYRILKQFSDGQRVRHRAKSHGVQEIPREAVKLGRGLGH